jgi:hypothetical protein
MWQQLERGDIEKARERLGHHLADMLRRQEQETKGLRAKHADELQMLEAKQAELETLDALIDRFSDEFQNKTEAGAAPDQESIREAPEGEDKPLAQDNIIGPAGASLPEKLAVRYVVPNLRQFRRFGS